MNCKKCKWANVSSGDTVLLMNNGMVISQHGKNNVMCLCTIPKTTNIYDKLLFYVLHDVARKKIVAKDIRTAIVEFAADAVSADRLAAIERYIENFESMSAWKMLSDADDLSFVIDRVLVKPDRGIEVLWMDGSVDGYEIPRYTPKGGISMI